MPATGSKRFWLSINMTPRVKSGCATHCCHILFRLRRGNVRECKKMQSIEIYYGPLPVSNINCSFPRHFITTNKTYSWFIHLLNPCKPQPPPHPVWSLLAWHHRLLFHHHSLAGYLRCQRCLQTGWLTSNTWEVDWLMRLKNADVWFVSNISKWFKDFLGGWFLSKMFMFSSFQTAPEKATSAFPGTVAFENGFEGFEWLRNALISKTVYLHMPVTMSTANGYTLEGKLIWTSKTNGISSLQR